MKPVCAELSLWNCRDRLLDFFLRKRADMVMVSLERELGKGVERCMGPRLVSVDLDAPLLSLSSSIPHRKPRPVAASAVDEPVGKSNASPPTCVVMR